MRIKLVFRYDGTPYHGWQVQRNAVTVQQVVQDSFERLIGKRPDITGCSRTDTGVHAREFVCHTDLDISFAPSKLPVALNAFLPESISLTEALQVDGSFHARYSVKTKTYRYYIHNSAVRDPFLANKALFWNKKLDYSVFSSLCGDFVGKHDFRAFMASGSKIVDTVRTVTRCTCSKESDVICLQITADGFLYNMVRIITGTLIEAAGGKSAVDIKSIIASEDRKNAGFTVPACGLYLWRVDY